MADNTTLDAGSGGDTIATDDIGGVKFPRSKIVIGADGTNDGDVSSANPLPVTGTLTAVTDITNTVTVDLGANNDVTMATLPDTAAGDLAAMVVDLAAIEVLLGTIDTDTGNIATAVQLIDDAIYADDADWVDGTSKHMLIGGLYQSARQTITDGDVGPIQLTSDGRLISQITDGSGNDLEFAKEADNWNAADHGMILFGRDVDSTPDKYRAIQTNANGHLKIEDGGNSITVDGTVASTQSGTWNVTNISGTISLPTGAATSANQSTLIGHVDGIEALLGTIDSDTSSLAGCVGGTELQVDVVGSLPAGTNAIGKLAANSGVDIGDVDVTSIAAGTNTIGGTISQRSSSTLYDGTTACTIKRASGVAAGGAPGTDALIGAVAGKKFRILALFLKATSATANNVYLATTTDTDVLGNSANPIPLAVDADGDNDSGFVLPFNEGGWTETSTANEALNLHTSAAQDIVWAITYIEVD